MADVSNIIDKIMEDAAAQEQAIEDRAQSAVHSILEQAEQDAQAAYDETMARAKAEAEAIRLRGESSARTERRKLLLSAKQELIEEAFRQAQEQLMQMSQEEFMRFVEEKLRHTTLRGEGKLYIPKRYKVGFLNLIALNAKLPGLKLSLADEPREVEGGFILSCGRVEENYTFGVLLSSLREELEAAVSKQLF